MATRLEWFLDTMSGRRRGLGASLARGLASVAAHGYRCAIESRNHRFDTGRTPAARLDRPVISVGNITMGGTGKTVIIAELARWLAQASPPQRVAVLTRGYKGHDSPVGADEAAMLRRQVPGLRVAADPDRHAAGSRLLARPDPPDVFLLDDGFQHRRLHRDLDIVALDATFDPEGPLGRLLPRGVLREPIDSIRRAGFVVITRADQALPDQLERIVARVQRVDAKLPIAICRHEPTALYTSAGPRPLDDLRDVRYLAFCGIGNPDAFARTLAALPGQCREWVRFDDHRAYSQADLDDLSRRAATMGAHVLLTTAKDFVKLALLTSSAPVWALDVGLAWLPDASAGDLLRRAVLQAARSDSSIGS